MLMSEITSVLHFCVSEDIVREGTLREVIPDRRRDIFLAAIWEDITNYGIATYSNWRISSISI